MNKFKPRVIVKTCTPIAVGNKGYHNHLHNNSVKNKTITSKNFLSNVSVNSNISNRNSFPGLIVTTKIRGYFMDNSNNLATDRYDGTTEEPTFDQYLENFQENPTLGSLRSLVNQLEMNPSSYGIKSYTEAKQVDDAFKTLHRNIGSMSATLLALRLQIDACLLANMVSTKKIGRKEDISKFRKRWSLLASHYPQFNLNSDSDFVRLYYSLRSKMGDYETIAKEYQVLQKQPVSSWTEEERNRCLKIITVMLEKIERYQPLLDQNLKNNHMPGHVENLNWDLTMKLLIFYKQIGGEPNADLFHTIMKTALRLSKPKNAFMVYREIKNLNITPNYDTYKLMLLKLKYDNDESMVEVLDDMTVCYKDKLSLDETFLTELISLASTVNYYGLGKRIFDITKNQVNWHRKNVEGYRTGIAWNTILENYMDLLTNAKSYEECLKVYLQEIANKNTSKSLTQKTAEIICKANSPFISSRLLQVVVSTRIPKTERFSSNTIIGMRLDLSGKNRTDELRRVLAAIYLDNAIAYVNSGMVELTPPMLRELALSCIYCGFPDRGIEILKIAKPLNLPLDNSFFFLFAKIGFTTSSHAMNKNFVALMDCMHQNDFTASSVKSLVTHNDRFLHSNYRLAISNFANELMKSESEKNSRYK